MAETPEQRRDAAVVAVIGAGGVVLGAAPLASAADPATVVAYQLMVGNPDPSQVDLSGVQSRTEFEDGAVLVPWQDPDAEVVIDA